MFNISKKSHRKLKLFFIAVLLLIFAVNLQLDMTAVYAQVMPVTVSANHLDFGTVFPGESQEGTYKVYYNEQGEDVFYRLVLVRKPLPEEHPEFPDGGDPDMPGYYRDLCPHLSEVSVDGEGDTPDSALVGPNDFIDTWTVYLEVPAVMGQVSQDHIGGLVTTNGEYGCDISVDILEPQIIGTGRSYLFSSLGGPDDAMDVLEEPSALALAGKPKLVLEKTVNTNLINPGQTGIIYTVLVSNSSEITAYNAKLNDKLPDGLLFTDTNQSEIEFKLGNINPGDTRTISYSVDADTLLKPGVYANTASVSADDFLPATASADVVSEFVEVLGLESGLLEPTGFSLNEFLVIVLLLIADIVSALGLKKHKYY